MRPSKPPGIYIEELPAFPATIEAAPTAVPVFIGFTAKVRHQGHNEQGQAVRIRSLREYEEHFGVGVATPFGLFAPTDQAALPPSPVPAPRIIFTDGQEYLLTPDAAPFYLYNSLRLFYLNGGAECYVLSLGLYKEAHLTPGTAPFLAAFEALAAHAAPTLFVCPDALRLSPEAYYEVARHLLRHCEENRRFALLDVYGGAISQRESLNAVVAAFRDGVGEQHLRNGAAYLPWLQTALLPATQISPAYFNAALLSRLKQGRPHANPRLHTGYALLKQAVVAYLNTLPASPALAGIYASTDQSRGVWKAPANVPLNGATGLTLPLHDIDQEGLSTDPQAGKSINAIRSFAGRGLLVWGARTLAGNSPEWRYVSVRRLCLMLEESVRRHLQSYVFSPNTAPTWAALQRAVENFLNNLWRQGALVGTKPEQSYSVQVGLGRTMTADDVLAGQLKLLLLVAPLRPAEFITLVFQQQMQAA